MENHIPKVLEHDSHAYDLAWNGIQIEVFLYERAKALHKELADHAAEIDQGNYHPFANAVLQQSAREVKLAVARLYDFGKNGDDIRSLRSAQTLLGRLAKERPTSTPQAVRTKLETVMPPEKIEADAWLAIRNWLSGALKAQKELHGVLRGERDGVLAHNLRSWSAPEDPISWSDLDSAVSVAVGLLDLLSGPLTNTFFVMRRELELADAAHRSAIALHRLLHKAGVAAHPRPEIREAVLSPFGSK